MSENTRDDENMAELFFLIQSLRKLKCERQLHLLLSLHLSLGTIIQRLVLEKRLSSASVVYDVASFPVCLLSIFRKGRLFYLNTEMCFSIVRGKTGAEVMK